MQSRTTRSIQCFRVPGCRTEERDRKATRRVEIHVLRAACAGAHRPGLSPTIQIVMTTFIATAGPRLSRATKRAPEAMIGLGVALLAYTVVMMAKAFGL